MTRTRWLLGCVGLFTATAGFVLIADPRMAADLTTNDVFVSLLGVVALSQAVFTGVKYASRDLPAVPSPELREGVRSPGESFDRDLRRLETGVRDRLRSTAIAVLSRFGPATTYKAEELLDEGTWTEDQLATAFFSTEVTESWIRRPPWLGGQPLVVAQAVSAIDALSGLVSDRLRDIPNSETHTARERGSEPKFESGEVPPVPASGTNDRWRGFEAVTLFTLALGAVRTSASLLLMGGVGVALIGYAAYGRVGTAPEVDLTVERTLEPDSPDPGEAVTVTVRVRNEGERTLPDLRIFDGVPPGLAVTDGGARHISTLRPDQETELTYTVEAEYGVHPFDPAFAIVGDLTGERWRTLEANDGTRLECHLPKHPSGETLIRRHVSKYAGQVTSDRGGSGVQFHETREYQRGDPISLIDWKSLARTGELTALEFSEERVVEVMVVVDVRPESNLAPAPAARSAVARSAEAAERLVAALTAENNRVGVVVSGSEDMTLGLGSGSDHELEARRLLAEYPVGLRETATDSTNAPDVSLIRHHLSGRTQVVLLSPLCDAYPVSLARHLEAAGAPVMVLSPNPTTTATPGETLASIERLVRLDTLHRAGIPVHEWHLEESLPTAIERGKQMRQVR